VDVCVRGPCCWREEKGGLARGTRCGCWSCRFTTLAPKASEREGRFAIFVLVEGSGWCSEEGFGVGGVLEECGAFNGSVEGPGDEATP